MSTDNKKKCTKWIEAIDYMISNRQIDFYTLDHLKKAFLAQLARDDTHPLGFDSQLTGFYAITGQATRKRYKNFSQRSVQI